MKRIQMILTVFLTAALLIPAPGITAAAAPNWVEADAQEQDDRCVSPYILTTDGFGTMYYQSAQWQRKHSFIAVTTAEGLTAPVVDEDGDINEFMEWEDYRSDLYTMTLDTGSLYQKYGDDIRIYLETSQRSYLEGLSWVSREFALRNDNVLAALPLETKTAGTCIWDGTITLGFSKEFVREMGTDEQLDAYWTSSSEFETFMNENTAIYEDWHTKYEAWSATADLSTMSGSERLESLTEAGVADPYLVLLDAKARAKAFLDANPDVYDCYNVGIRSLEQPLLLCQTYSAWSGMGDIDEDGAVTAADASEMLRAGACAGAGKDNGFTTRQRETGDLNSDYHINAEDASLALMYAAALGAEPDAAEDVGDFILRQQRGR